MIFLQVLYLLSPHGKSEMLKIQHGNTTHGQAKRGQLTDEYRCWLGIRQRCLNKTAKDYPRYGGRGITISPTWENYAVFLQDMGSRPSSAHSIERIDVNKGYSKENCIWATRLTQANNRRLAYNSPLGINGILYQARQKKYRAYGTYAGQRAHLYYGSDFFEACCARKSWERQRSLDKPSFAPIISSWKDKQKCNSK